MRYTISILAITTLAIVAQNGVAPALLPPVLRPDVGMLLAMSLLAFCPREYALIVLFCLGMQADLFGSPRFGLLTLSYLLGAGIVLLAAWRELTRGDLLAAWIGGVAGTALAHTLYILLGRLCGLQVNWGQGFAVVLSLVLASAVWGLPCACICAKYVQLFGVTSPAVKERWAAEARYTAARRGKILRA